MNELELKRRSFMFGLGGLGISHVLPQGVSLAQAAPRGYVLGVTEGEHLVHFRDHGNIFIKVSSATGSDNLALGTQQVTVGAGIPIHRHFEMDEAFYVLEGSGIFTLNDLRHSFEKGGTIFIPKNSWHGFANPDHELLLLWIVTLPAWTASFVTPALRRAYRQSSSRESRSMRLPAICDGIQIVTPCHTRFGLRERRSVTKSLRSNRSWNSQDTTTQFSSR